MPAHQRFVLGAAGLIILAVCLAGCPTREAAPVLPPEEIIDIAPAAGKPWPRTFTDDLGTPVTLAGPPARIVSIAPGLTEAIFMLGAGDRVVGVTEFCNYPPEAAEREVIGGMTNPSVEKIIALSPDLVLVTRGAPIDVVNSLREAGLTVIGKSPETVRAVIEDIRDLGEYLGIEGQAERTAESLEQRLELAVEEGREVFGEAGGPTVLMIIGLEPVFVAGPGSFADDMISLCGGRNVIGAAEDEQVSAWPQYSLEKIVEHDPQIIISTLQSHEVERAATLERLRDLSGWRDLSAVKRGRVYDVDADTVLRTGPRLLDGLEAMSTVIQLRPGEDASV